MGWTLPGKETRWAFEMGSVTSGLTDELADEIADELAAGSWALRGIPVNPAKGTHASEAISHAPDRRRAI
jgi:hypothetical protein